jgi:hypothetical protein
MSVKETFGSLRPSGCCKGATSSSCQSVWPEVISALEATSTLRHKCDPTVLHSFTSTQTQMISSRMPSVMHDGSLASDLRIGMIHELSSS